MPRRRYWFRREPTAEAYASLLGLGARRAMQALLVIRPNLGLVEAGRAALERLQPWLLSTSTVTEWPGTKLYENQTAQLSSYALTDESRAMILTLTSRLYGWRQPELPEDLCLAREDGDPWLVSTAHEEEAHLILSEQEFTELLQNTPEVGSLLELE